LRSIRSAYYPGDDRRERFVGLFHDIEVQCLIFDAYMYRKLVARAIWPL
jgi:hypothetical protein